ncbi:MULTISPECIES: DMT family transporter [Tepidiphilus]|uniref:DMT family transporter n=1 Tax=Tepidiphilus TaxID=203470 RepID=UPI001C8F8819|nr:MULTISPECIES: DMT family transporter [Tepidiphilus]
MTTREHTALGLWMAFAGAFGFSFKAVLVKLAYRHGVDAETILALRMGFALPFFLLLGWAAEKKATHRLTARQWGTLFVLGFLGYYGSSYLDFLGLRYISAGLERMILFCYPTLVVLMSAAFLGTRLDRRTVASLAVCYAGLALALVHDLGQNPGSVHDVLLGGALVFGSAVAFALYLLGTGQVVGKIGATRLSAWATTFACLLVLGQFVVMRPLPSLWQQPAPVLWLGLAMALVSTVAPVWLASEAIRRLGPGPVSMISTLGPVLTLLLGAWLLDEPLTFAQLAGCGLVIGGVVMMSRRPRPAATAAAEG